MLIAREVKTSGNTAMRSSAFVLVTGSLLLAAVQPAIAQKEYGPGIADTEIKPGQTMPYRVLPLAWARLAGSRPPISG